MDLGIDDKTALVSGSNRGTGLAIAQALKAEGVRVIVHSLAAGHAEATRDTYNFADFVEGNICTDEGTKQVLDQLAEKNLTIDILVNNYGTALPGKWDTLNTQQWIDAYQHNMLSAFRLAQALNPGMQERGWGRIIQLGTIGSMQPNFIMPHYYAAKAALANATVSLAKAMKHTGITVNTVSPGYIHTEELEAAYRIRARKKGWGEDWADIEKAIVEHEFPNPVGRIATREEVASLVVYLCSQQAAFINGQNICVDGGAVATV